MGPHRAQAAPRPKLLLLLAMAVLLPACGGEDGAPGGEAPFQEPADTTGGPTGDASAEEEDLPESQLAVLPVTFRQAAAGFPHDPHRQISCTRCHGTIEGHATHRTVECSACHNAPDAGTGTAVPSRAQCMSCHHEPRQRLDCSRCHEPEGLGWIQVPQRLGVASATRTRSLPFLHGRHEEVECRSCHTGGPGLRVERACSSCHQEHHRQEAECLTCHASLPLETHELSSHEGCGGAGCHSDPVVPALRMTRNVCLACHQDQVDHERGQECATCHLVGEEPREEGP